MLLSPLSSSLSNTCQKGCHPERRPTGRSRRISISIAHDDRYLRTPKRDPSTFGHAPAAQYLDTGMLTHTPSRCAASSVQTDASNKEPVMQSGAMGRIRSIPVGLPIEHPPAKPCLLYTSD